jgi:hypothetical protein
MPSADVAPVLPSGVVLSLPLPIDARPLDSVALAAMKAWYPNDGFRINTSSMEPGA